MTGEDLRDFQTRFSQQGVPINGRMNKHVVRSVSKRAIHTVSRICN